MIMYLLAMDMELPVMDMVMYLLAMDMNFPAMDMVTTLPSMGKIFTIKIFLTVSLSYHYPQTTFLKILTAFPSIKRK